MQHADFVIETAEHILCECEALPYKRQKNLGLGFPSISEFNEVDFLEKLLNFLKREITDKNHNKPLKGFSGGRLNYNLI